MKTKSLIKELIKFADYCNIPRDKVKEYIRYAPVKSRSNQQLRLYWSAWLPAILFHLPERLAEINTTDKLHYALKFSYCYHVRPDKFDERYVKDDKGKWIKGFIPFSIALDELPHDEAQAYFDYVGQWVTKNIGCFLDEILDNQ